MDTARALRRKCYYESAAALKVGNTVLGKEVWLEFKREKAL